MIEDDQFEGTLDESGRLRFHTMCPAGHFTIQAFTPRELQTELDEDRLTFQCLYCGARWSATMSQRTQIREELER